MVNRKLGCLTLFLFVALCASAILNIFLAVALFGRVTTGAVREEPMTKFREIIVQRGGSGVSDRIAVIVLRGLISSSIPGSTSDNMVDDLRTHTTATHHTVELVMRLGRKGADQ